MSEAPERIGLVSNGLGGFALWNREDNKFDPAIEYIRADLFDAVKDERDNYKARVKVLTEALEFYADENTYVTHYEREACDCCTRIFEPINEDRGETAREALQENTDETNP